MRRQLKSATIKKIVHSKLKKFFEENIQGSKGWHYAKQAKYDPWDIFERLVQACCEKSSIEDVCGDFPGCSADTVQDHVNPLDFEPIVRQVNTFLRETTLAFHFHGNQIITLAMDITNKPFYGDPDHELSVGSKPKDGTYYFNRYFSVSLITPKYRLPVYFRPLRKQDSLSPYDLIQGMWDELRSWLPLQRLLGDAYFYSKEVVESCDFYGFEYLFNMTEYSWVKEAIAVIRETVELMAKAVGLDLRDVKGFYRWLGTHGLRVWKIPNQAVQGTSPASEVVLRIRYQKTKKRSGQIEEKLGFFSYVTNIHASGNYLATLYGSKWGIETGYRVENMFQAYTTSQYTSMRSWLTGLGFMFVSLWLYLNLLLNRYQTELPDSDSLPFTFRAYSTDTLVLIVKKFLRRIQPLWRQQEVF